MSRMQELAFRHEFFGSGAIALFSVDGAPFPTSPGYNSTLTIQALASRSAAAIVNPRQPVSVDRLTYAWPGTRGHRGSPKPGTKPWFSPKV
jgi:hypothetical protein